METLKNVPEVKPNNYQGLDPGAVIKTEHLKRHLLESADLKWIEFIVLCSIAQLEDQKEYHDCTGVASSDVVKNLGMQKDHVYRAIATLGDKEYINIDKPNNPWFPRSLSINGFGIILLKKVKDGASIVPIHSRMETHLIPEISI